MQSLDDAPAPLAIEEDTPPIALSDADVMALFAGAAAGAASGDSRIYLSGPVLFGEPTEFVEDMVVWCRWREPTERQAAWLANIADRLRETRGS